MYFTQMNTRFPSRLVFLFCDDDDHDDYSGDVDLLERKKNFYAFCYVTWKSTTNIAYTVMGNQVMCLIAQ